MKGLWNIFSILAVVFTYYATWQHEPLWIALGFVPQLINFGYAWGKK